MAEQAIGRNGPVEVQQLLGFIAWRYIPLVFRGVKGEGGLKEMPRHFNQETLAYFACTDGVSDGIISGEPSFFECVTKGAAGPIHA
jgi:hypothetical protein